MIPSADVKPAIPSPLPKCEMPKPEDVTEEGFGWFQDTWFMGRVPIAEASEVVREEGEIIAWLDRTARDPGEFEVLASAIESCETDELPDGIAKHALAAGLSAWVADRGDPAPLEGLEIGVAGLAHALSAIGCLTAASCRSHVTQHSWSDCPVVFFAAPSWRLAILADLIRDAECGLDGDRDMLKIYGPSIRDTHRLAKLIVSDRQRFRRRPDSPDVKCVALRRLPAATDQLTLMLDSDPEYAA